MAQHTKPAARGRLAEDGRLIAVLGPTNTGKTHFAVERMLAHESGMIGLPLRLLAREIYDRVSEQAGPEATALITGEEKIAPPGARYFICTVESMPLSREVAFLAVDEIQLCADPERGHVFTDRLLHARGHEETLLLGAETMRPLIRQLVPGATFISRSRFSELSYLGVRKISRLPRRSAIVAFSAEQVYGLAELVRRQRGGAAVVMGALSPRTRNAQVALYQSGDVDFMVATDAIGMGLNMDVDHVAFASMRKFDGHHLRPLKPHEIGQIAGRAGRYLNDGTFGPTGEAGDMAAEVVSQIESHRFEPVRVLQWRSRDLDFSSLSSLIESLEAPPPEKGLARARAASDLQALKAMADMPGIASAVAGSDDVSRLWQICQIPDFRNITPEEHVRLLATVHGHLTENDGRLPESWVNAQVARLDRVDGEIDTLAQRLAHIRTWTFIANRGDWLDDPVAWQERTREIEDRLSDSLHEALTQRFIDRRTSMLMKRLKQNDELQSEVSAEGDVTVEGEYVGRLQGFQFIPDPRAGGLDGKALRAAAQKALRVMVNARAEQLGSTKDELIELSDHGRIRWQGQPVARLVKGHDRLAPRVELIADDLLDAPLREPLQKKLDAWLRAHLEQTIGQLMDLHDAVNGKTATPTVEPVEKSVGGEAALTGLVRGIAFQLTEGYGVLDRRQVADQVRTLDQAGRGILRRYGVRFGEFSIFLPALLKPAQARLLVILWGVFNDSFGRAAEPSAPAPSPPAPGLCSIPAEPDYPADFYGAAGFRLCGGRAVRTDMLERLGELIRKARAGDTPTAVQDGKAAAPPSDAAAEEPAPSGGEPAGPAEQPDATEVTETAPQQSDADGAESKPVPALPRGTFLATTEMMSLVGCSGEEFESILRGLGYRPQRWRPEPATDGTPSTEESAEVIIWRQRPRGGKPGYRGAKRPHGAQSASQKPPRRDGAKGDVLRRTGKQKKRPAEQTDRKPAKSRPLEKPIDPDSPFAALAALKFDGQG